MGRRFDGELEQRRVTRPWHWHEHRLARRETNRRVRHTTRDQLQRGDYDLLPKAPRTQGWRTW